MNSPPSCHEGRWSSHFNNQLQGQMSTDAYSDHLETLITTLQQVPSSHAFAFGAACVERIWPIYERASQGKVWSSQPLLRETVNRVWSWLLGDGPRPEGFAAHCEGKIDFEITSDAASAASEVAKACYGLARVVERQEPHQVYPLAEINLSLLGSYIYMALGLQPSTENYQVVYAHPLMHAEVSRQLQDLSTLQQPSSRSLVLNLRATSDGQSVLGSHWYA